jgi:hypothetical protein
MKTKGAAEVTAARSSELLLTRIHFANDFASALDAVVENVGWRSEFGTHRGTKNHQGNPRIRLPSCGPRSSIRHVGHSAITQEIASYSTPLSGPEPGPPGSPSKGFKSYAYQ